MVTIEAKTLANQLNIEEGKVSRTLKLLDEGATVPFIARYRKEATGNLDEVQIAEIRDQLLLQQELEKRKESILKSLEERELLTDELATRIKSATTMTILEDIYLPFRQKKNSRAQKARDRGLEPLAREIFSQKSYFTKESLIKFTEGFLSQSAEITSVSEALAGARDIMAEWISEDTRVRKQLRRLFVFEGEYHCRVKTGKEEEGKKFRDYFKWSERVKGAPSHRVLAMRRGEAEKVITLKVRPDTERAITLIQSIILRSSTTEKNPATSRHAIYEESHQRQQDSQSNSKHLKPISSRTTGTNGQSVVVEQLIVACEDSYKRLLLPSLETEIRKATKEAADVEAISVFADNLRNLLLAPPLGRKKIMAIDPGFRTGCKVVCLDASGNLLHHSAIFPHQNKERDAKAASEIVNLVDKYTIEVIALGNGTAGRETQVFLQKISPPLPCKVVMVDESGASIYSASKVAREEFPDKDITVRGSVSIGRRLMDPLAELVKLDPKSIGVGQYQHDVDQKLLKNSLDDVVQSCVNGVGVELNTASRELLSYVSGLGPALAANIIQFRQAHGAFNERKELLKVKKLGPKAYEQCAGFLRIRDSKNPLDSSGVHPETYPLVKKMLHKSGLTLEDSLGVEDKLREIALEDFTSEQFGLPTLKDIIAELAKPGRDPRQPYEDFQYEEGVEKIEDLEEGMILPGIVKNVTNFGAFVDVGVHQDGLVHISQMADKFVKNPADVVKVQQRVKVRVMEVDIKRKRIALSMKNMQNM